MEQSTYLKKHESKQLKKMAKVENSILELQNDLEELKDGEKHIKK